MNAIPKWLADALDEVAMPSDVRDRLAERIIESIPARDIASTIAQSAGCVLKQRGISDAGGSLSREIGRNAAQTTYFAIIMPRGDEEAA